MKQEAQLIKITESLVKLSEGNDFIMECQYQIIVDEETRLIISRSEPFSINEKIEMDDEDIWDEKAYHRMLKVEIDENIIFTNKNKIKRFKAFL